ncbi:MAG: hypothetical protein ACTIBJ_14850 [Pseudomonas helleri]|uniref:hypothetical protein n=1 Tax=Pseudomonas helleri TaxID=1608996 RepID=UPI003F9D101E
MSNERPILFSAPMVRAILEGRKTVTRRAMKIQPVLKGNLWEVYGAGWADCIKCVRAMPGHSLAIKCPFGQAGDRLWVRETWLPDPDADHEAWDDHTDTYVSWSGCGSRIDGVPPALRKPEHCIYREGWAGSDLVWRPSIHMPRWASRILLEITSVRVERLQDITPNDCVKEGAWLIEDVALGRGHEAHQAFADLWNSTGGNWDENPWVWVVEFEQVKP